MINAAIRLVAVRDAETLAASVRIRRTVRPGANPFMNSTSRIPWIAKEALETRR